MVFVDVWLHTDAPTYSKKGSKWWGKILDGVDLGEVGGWTMKGSWLKFRPWEMCKSYRVGSLEEGTIVVLVAFSQYGELGGGVQGLFIVEDGAFFEEKVHGFSMRVEGVRLLWEATTSNVRALAERFPEAQRGPMRRYMLADYNWAIALKYALDHSDMPRDVVEGQLEEKFEWSE